MAERRVFQLEDRVLAVVPVVSLEGPKGTLALEQSRRHVQRTSFVMGGLALLVGVLLAFAIAHSLARRLRAISEVAATVEGLELFTNLGCMVCHTGEFLGGSMYEKVGTVEPWPNQADQGRYSVTKRDGDRMMFKVPGLRNVAETAPYFHDGSVPTLQGAVSTMAKHQLGLELASDEVDAVVAWLKSLTGKLPQQYLAAPPLPKTAGREPGSPKHDG